MIKPIPGPLDLEEEHLKVPANLMEDLDLEYTSSAEGLVISGILCYWTDNDRVAMAQGKQGIWFLLFADRENTGNFAAT